MRIAHCAVIVKHETVKQGSAEQTREVEIYQL